MAEAVWGMASVGVGGRGDSATFWDVGGWLVEDADFLGMDGVLLKFWLQKFGFRIFRH